MEWLRCRIFVRKTYHKTTQKQGGFVSGFHSSRSSDARQKLPYALLDDATSREYLIMKKNVIVLHETSDRPHLFITHNAISVKASKERFILASLISRVGTLLKLMEQILLV